MLRYRLAKQLKMLMKEGEELAPTTDESVEADKVRLWFAQVSDVLKSILPPDSRLLFELDKGIPETKEYSKDTVKKLVQRTSDIISRARSVNPLQLRSSESGQLEREINTIINQWPFRRRLLALPFVLLLIASVFAFTGAIKIQGYKIDLGKLAEEAVDRAKKDIESQRKQIDADLKLHGDNQKKRIQEDVDEYITSLKEKYTPNMEAVLRDTLKLTEKLESRVELLAPKTEALSGKLSALERTLQTIEPSMKHGIIESLKTALDRSVYFIWGLIILSTAAVVVSILAWRNSKKGPSTS